MSSELTMATMLANPKIRQSIRPMCMELEWISDQARNLVEYFCEDNRATGGVPHPSEMRSFLSGFLIDEEIDSVLRKLYEFTGLPEDRIPSVLSDFQKFYETKMLTKILNTNKADATQVISDIKALPQVEASTIPLLNMGDIDVEAVIEEELGASAVIESGFNFIKRSSPWNGYIRGQVVQFLAAPGTGKTLSLLNETWKAMRDQQCVTHFVALGDMMKIDFITRYASIATGVPFNEVALNPKKYYTDEVRRVLKNLLITVVPSGAFDAMSLHDFIENQASSVASSDIVVVDYDANFAMTNENSYKDQELVYNTLSKISRPINKQNRLVFVASQPKIQYWGEEELPMEASSDSSRKQAIIDLQITFGRNNRIHGTKAGIAKVAKARRGNVNERSFYRITECGRFEELTSDQYTMLQSFKN